MTVFSPSDKSNQSESLLALIEKLSPLFIGLQSPFAAHRPSTCQSSRVLLCISLGSVLDIPYCSQRTRRPLFNSQRKIKRRPPVLPGSGSLSPVFTAPARPQACCCSCQRFLGTFRLFYGSVSGAYWEFFLQNWSTHSHTVGGPVVQCPPCDW